MALIWSDSRGRLGGLEVDDMVVVIKLWEYWIDDGVDSGSSEGLTDLRV